MDAKCPTCSRSPYYPTAGIPATSDKVTVSDAMEQRDLRAQLAAALEESRVLREALVQLRATYRHTHHWVAPKAWACARCEADEQARAALAAGGDTDE